MTCTCRCPRPAPCYQTSGVRVAPADLTLLHERSEGWGAALQMAALTLRGATDPVQLARALNVHGHTMADYFVEEVLQQQPPEVARFMLETSVLDVLTADACAAVTGREDAAVMLSGLEAANLFVVALDVDRASYRYHHLVHDVLRTVLHGRLVDVRGAQALAWFEAGHLNRAAEAAHKADVDARRLGFEQHPFAVDYLRVLSGVALEQQDLDTAEQLTERTLDIRAFPAGL
jgi:ATP/maltotriose-dependent transcriptional regulator MalT